MRFICVFFMLVGTLVGQGKVEINNNYIVLDGQKYGLGALLPVPTILATVYHDVTIYHAKNRNKILNGARYDAYIYNYESLSERYKNMEGRIAIHYRGKIDYNEIDYNETMFTIIVTNNINFNETNFTTRKEIINLTGFKTIDYKDYHTGTSIYKNTNGPALTFNLIIFEYTDKVSVPNFDYGTMTDQEGNTYKTIKIGNQVWMAENLRVKHYRNGEEIPNITDDSQWKVISKGAYCVYDNNYTYESVYGCLYNWYAVNDRRHIAPEGWHVPTEEEWKTLEKALGMIQSQAYARGYRGDNQGSKLAGRADLWNSGPIENNAAFGESGFSALPAGMRCDFTGLFDFLGGYASFWSSTKYGSDYAWHRSLGNSTSEVCRSPNYKHYGFSVRLVMD